VVNSPDTASSLVHVGRQPIYDRAGDVVAYELLFRDAAGATQSSRSSAQATSRVIVAAFTEFGLGQLVGSRACFINVTREFITGELPVPFDSDHAVLEIIETVDVDDAVVAGVTELIGRGFTIALDDYTPGSHDRLLPLTTYVKIDLLDADPAKVADIVRSCRQHHPHVYLVAERLETEDDLHRAFDLGFDYFQGHVLGRPHVLSTAGLTPARLGLVRLISALTEVDVDIDEVATLISQDPALTFRLLQATNSAAAGLKARVSSVRDAIVLLGLPTVRQWVTLMLLSDLTDSADHHMEKIMTRARVCQTVAEQVGLSGDAAFSVGLLSGVADLLGEPSAQLATQLPLAEDVAGALAGGAGRLGGVLAAVRDYERENPADLADLIGPDAAVHVHLAAVAWCNDLMRLAEPVGAPQNSAADT
jgi:c-di-GMP-related signal transduction protein